MKNSYDVIIIGAGPAGMACSIILAQNGKKCLLLERKKDTTGKVCGDGLTSRCVNTLKYIGVDIDELFGLGAKKILYNITFYDCETYKKRFVEDRYNKDFSIGISRDIFDTFLCENAKKLGVDILFGINVDKIERINNEIIINGLYEAKTYVNAEGVIGALKRGKFDLPVGISSRIVGRGNVKDECFYFFRQSVYGDGYAWMFPVAENIWNVGCWSHRYKKDIKHLYFEFENVIKNDYVVYEFYDRKPQGALLGIGNSVVGNDIYVGDAALLTDSYSGEGISFAIESGINKAMTILGKEQILFPDKSVVGLSDQGMEKYDFREKY